MSDTATREKGILFSPPMIRAILDGKKTQTRRVIKEQPPAETETFAWVARGKHNRWVAQADDRAISRWFLCPYGAPGDRLWVRESCCQLWFNRHDGWQTFYKADDNPDYVQEAAQGAWRSPIHMPRKYARILLEITSVRIERLQVISQSDAAAEGVDFIPLAPAALYHRTAFAGLWDKINGKKYPWSSNPFVWCISFRRIEVP